MLRSPYLLDVLVPQIARFDQIFTEKVFPTFENPEAQAEKAAQEYWDRKMSEPVGEDGPDEDFGDIADDAHQKSLDFYFTMASMHTTVLNLFAAGLYHLFEQQAATLLLDWTGKRPKYPFSVLEALAANANGALAIDVKGAPNWTRINELRLVANVVKHAEGDSADKLRAVNPVYFRHPAVRGNAALEQQIPDADQMLGEPLTGDAFYVTKGDYDEFVHAVVDFWKWLGAVVG